MRLGLDLGLSAVRRAVDPQYHDRHLLSVRSDDRAGFETWLGAPADMIHQFYETGNGTSTWAQNLTYAQAAAAAFTGVAIRHDHAFPLCSTTQPMTETTAGTHDATIIAMLETIAGYDKNDVMILRPGWEFGFQTAYPWSASSGAGKPAEYIAAFRHVVDLARAVSPRFRISWCCTTTTTDYTAAEFNSMSAYPGDEYVDIFGMDVYVTAATDLSGKTGARAFYDKRVGTYGLDWLWTQAQAHDKPIAIHEYGCNADAPDFHEGMAAWLRGKTVTHAGYWDKNNGVGTNFQDRLSNDQYPNSSVQFKKDFGPITIVTPSTFTCQSGSALSLTLEASKPVTWNVSGGANSSQFTISSGALISRSSLTNGSYEVSIRAVDNRGQTAEKTLTITAQASSILPEAQFVVARSNVAPSTSHKNALSAFIAALKSCGAWDRLDLVYGLTNEDSQAAYLNIKETDFPLTAAGAPTFAANVGVVGDGASVRLNSAFIPSLPGRNFQQNDFTLGIYSYTNLANGASQGIDAGAETSLSFGRNTSGQVIGRPAVSGTKTMGPSGSWPGFVAVSRLSATSWISYVNGVQSQTGADASTHFMHKQLSLLGSDLGGGLNRLGMVILGASLDATQHAAVASAVAAYIAAHP